MIAMREQAIDELLAAIGRLVVEEFVGLADARNAAGQIQIDAAHELGVAGRADRMNLLLGPMRGQLVVDPLGQLAGCSGSLNGDQAGFFGTGGATAAATRGSLATFSTAFSATGGRERCGLSSIDGHRLGNGFGSARRWIIRHRACISCR